MLSKGEHQSVPLSVLLKRELAQEKIERPKISHGQANQIKKGEDFTFLNPECQRVLGDEVTTFSIFGLFDGHNGSAAAIYTRENLLQNVLSAIPADLNRYEWVAALPRALVAGFVKTDKEFQEKAPKSGTTVTFVIIEGWVVTVASVGDSLCVLESAEGGIYHLSADHRLECNEEERERITTSGGEVGRLNTGGGTQVECCRGMSPDAAACQIVKPLEKPNPPQPPPKKSGKKAFKSIFRKKTSESCSNTERDYDEPDVVEELFEEGSASLSDRSGHA
ncbi:hypothetical protein KY285_031930 [Solanum tuberosum]|nr:hypothetical protein KY285_031930 [Solanum tuberosum]